MVSIFGSFNPFIKRYFFEISYLCRWMKKVIAILLFLCLLLPFYGTYTWLKVQKKQVKRAVKWKMIEGISQEQLETLVFSREEAEKELRWIHSREFEYRGEMYDIVETIECSDSIRYICWWDHEETKLNRQLAGLVEKVFQKNPITRNHQQQVVLFYRMLFCNGVEMHDFTQYPSSISQQSSEFCCQLINNPAPPTPPPEWDYDRMNNLVTGFNS